MTIMWYKLSMVRALILFVKLRVLNELGIDLRDVPRIHHVHLFLIIRFPLVWQVDLNSLSCI